MLNVSPSNGSWQNIDPGLATSWKDGVAYQSWGLVEISPHPAIGQDDNTLTYAVDMENTKSTRVFSGYFLVGFMGRYA